MAQKTVVTVVCDLPHDGEIEGSETVSFSFDGSSYDIDVCASHAKELHDTFTGYAEHSRRVSTGAARRGGRAAQAAIPARLRIFIIGVNCIMRSMWLTPCWKA